MSENMQQDVLRVLLSEEEIRAKCQEMGARISQDYKGKNLMLVTVLKGGVSGRPDARHRCACRN